MRRITVTAIIPNYNGMFYLRPLITSLKEQVHPFDEIIIIDDASTDKSPAFIKKTFPEIHLVSNKTNKGFAASVNTGIKLAQSTHVSLINNDILLDKNWLKNAIKNFNSENIAAVATNILIARTENKIDSQGDNYFINGIAAKRNNLFLNNTNNSRSCRVFSACAAAAVYNKQLIIKAGLFDEFFESYYEDIDLAFRLNLMGYKIIYTPYSLSYHYVNSSYKTRYDKMLFNIYRNEEIVFWTNMPENLLLRYCLSRLFFVFLQTIVKMFKLQFFIYLKAKYSVIKNIKYLLMKRKFNMKLKKISDSDLLSLLSKNWISSFFKKQQAMKTTSISADKI